VTFPLILMASLSVFKKHLLFYFVFKIVLLKNFYSGPPE